MKPGIVFWLKVNKESDPPAGFEHLGNCWQWLGHITQKGYGRYANTYAYRYSYILNVGEIPSGMEVDHLCHNRACVNPNHLRLCTHAENTRNRPKIAAHNTSGFRGVYRQGKKWRTDIFYMGRKIYLGVFDTPEEAYETWKVEAKKLYGEFANVG